MPLVVEVRRVRSPNEPDLSSRRVEILPGLRVRDRGFIVAHLSVLVTSCQDRGLTHGPGRRLEGNQDTPQGHGVAVDFRAASHRAVHMSSAMHICHWRSDTHGHVHPRAACGPDPLSQDNSTVRCDLHKRLGSRKCCAGLFGQHSAVNLAPRQTTTT